MMRAHRTRARARHVHGACGARLSEASVLGAAPKCPGGGAAAAHADQSLVFNEMVTSLKKHAEHAPSVLGSELVEEINFDEVAIRGCPGPALAPQVLPEPHLRQQQTPQPVPPNDRNRGSALLFFSWFGGELGCAERKGN